MQLNKYIYKYIYFADSVRRNTLYGKILFVVLVTS